MRARIQSDNKHVDAIINFIYENLDKHTEMLGAIEGDDLQRFAELCKDRFTDVDGLTTIQLFIKATGYDSFSTQWKDNPYSPHRVMLEVQGELRTVDAETHQAFETLRTAFYDELDDLLEPKLSEESLFLAAARCQHPGFIRILAVDYAKKKQGVNAAPHRFFDLALEQVILEGKKEHFDLLAPHCRLGSFWCWLVDGTDTLQTPKVELARKVRQLNWLDINQVTTQGSVLHTMLDLSCIVTAGMAEKLGFFLDAGIDVTITNVEGKNAFETPNFFGKYLLEIALNEVKQSRFSPYKPGQLINSVSRRNVDWLTRLLMNDGKPPALVPIGQIDELACDGPTM